MTGSIASWDHPKISVTRAIPMSSRTAGAVVTYRTPALKSLQGEEGSARGGFALLRVAITTSATT